jgi:hypothetical protein
MVAPWQSVQTIPLLFDRADVEKAAVDTLVLEPAQ